MITDPEWSQLGEVINLICIDAVKRIILRVGSYSDPVTLWSVDETFFFNRVISIRYPQYKRGGSVTIPRDEAFIFGKTLRSKKDRHVIPKHGGREITFVSWLVDCWTDDDDIILDPFCGTGVTAEACERLGRKWIGIEIEKQACDETIMRLTRLKS